MVISLLTLNSLGKEQRERVREGKELGRWMEGRTESRKKGADGGRQGKAGREQWSHVRERCGEDAV